MGVPSLKAKSSLKSYIQYLTILRFAKVKSRDVKPM